MSLFPGSRYLLGENNKRITATKLTRNSKTITYLHDRRVYKLEDMKNPVIQREIISGDLLDGIAFEEIGDSSKMFLIADINEMFYVDEEMDIGRKLLVPDIEDFKAV
jgi:hypothetical protein